MKDNKLAYLLLIQILAVGIVAYLLFTKEDKVGNGIVINNYKTDSIHNHFTYQVPESKGIVINPKFVITYPETNIDGISIKLKDSLLVVIDSLNKKLTTIDQKYLKMYPEANKLIYGKFTQDSLKLDLLNIQGNMVSLIYPVNYEAYQYSYKDGKLLGEALKGSKKPPHSKITSNLIVAGGYDPIWKNPLASIRYSVDYRKLNATVEPILYIQKDPHFYLQGKLGYRIK